MYVAPMMTRSTARFASLIGGDDAAAQRRRRARDSRAYLEDRALADLQAVVSREPSSPSDQLVLEDRCEALEVPLLELCSLADLWVCCRCRRCNESLSLVLASSLALARSFRYAWLPWRTGNASGHGPTAVPWRTGNASRHGPAAGHGHAAGYDAASWWPWNDVPARHGYAAGYAAAWNGWTAGHAAAWYGWTSGYVLRRSTPSVSCWPVLTWSGRRNGTTTGYGWTAGHGWTAGYGCSAAVGLQQAAVSKQPPRQYESIACRLRACSHLVLQHHSPSPSPCMLLAHLRKAGAKGCCNCIHTRTRQILNPQAPSRAS